MAQNYVLLKSIELMQAASSVTFSSIPQTGYTDLKLVVSLRGTISMNWADITVNGGTTAISMNHLLNSTGSTIYSQQYSPLRFQNNGSTFTTNAFSAGECYFFNYSNTSYQKTMSVEGTQSSNSSNFSQHFASGLWASTAAITSITITPDGGSGNLEIGSTLSLYGLAATGTTPVSAPFASGGNIVTNDGTYWYHAFLSSGTFTPFKALTADVLIVAGGAGAVGNRNDCGGGGAGGFRALTAQSFSLTDFPVIVGAGGAGTNRSTGNSGSNSTISTISATGGGRNATSGGSGGGGGRDGASSGGAGNAGGFSPVEGYAGGTTASGAFGGAAGGGGAGGVGSAGSGGSATSEKGGNGGIGSYSAISGGATTGLGVLSGGNYYFAGGGGGGTESGARNGISSGGTGGGGNGSQGNVTAATSAIANTGSGGGGAGIDSGAGGSGSSGVVIIRYTMV
jgi:hypothetical protein